MNRLTNTVIDVTLALIVAAVILGSTVDTGPDEIVTAQLVADEVADLERQAHPSSTQPSRKRHASVAKEQ